MIEGTWAADDVDTAPAPGLGLVPRSASRDDDASDDEEKEDGAVSAWLALAPMLLRLTPSPTSSTRPRTRDTWKKGVGGERGG